MWRGGPLPFAAKGFVQTCHVFADSCNSGYFADDVFIFGIQNAISAAAINANVPPKKNGAFI